jgi:hypothetical protein
MHGLTINQSKMIVKAPKFSFQVVNDEDCHCPDQAGFDYVGSEETARWAREHNDSNMLALGARTISEEFALTVVRIWLTTEFKGGRHANRVAMIEEEVSGS